MTQAFECNDGRGIPDSWVCDGEVDCGEEGEDEQMDCGEYYGRGS